MSGTSANTNKVPKLIQDCVKMPPVVVGNIGNGRADL